MLNNTKNGQSMFELIVAIGVVSVTLVAIVGLVSATIANSTFTKNRTFAARHTNDAIEWVREQRDAGFSQLASRGSSTGSYYCVPTLNWPASAGQCSSSASNQIPGTNFFREVRLIYNAGSSPNEVEVQAATYWKDSSGSHESRASTIVSNWRTN